MVSGPGRGNQSCGPCDVAVTVAVYAPVCRRRSAQGGQAGGQRQRESAGGIPAFLWPLGHLHQLFY